MKLVSFNVNGLRTLNIEKVLSDLSCDVFCCQETKLNRSSLSSSEAFADGYYSFFSFARQLGYSGVATFCRAESTPLQALNSLCHLDIYFEESVSSTIASQEGWSSEYLKELDGEGRVVITVLDVLTSCDSQQTRQLFLVNVYSPRADGERIERLKFKRDFQCLLKFYIQRLLQHNSNCHVIVVGDLNVAHHRIDHCEGDLDSDFDKNANRLWLTELLDEGKLVDAFRQCHPERKNAFTCWNTKISARENNFGTRIDYILCDNRLLELCPVSCDIMPEYKGSDHCPVWAEFRGCKVISAAQIPQLATKFMPEFRGNQTKLHSFVVKGHNQIVSSSFACKRSAEVECQNKTKRLKTSAYSNQPLLFNYFVKPVAISDHVKQNDDSSCEQPCNNSTSNVSLQTNEGTSDLKGKSAFAWKQLFKGSLDSAATAPLCTGHREPCVLRTVKKAGPNLNRKFYVCARGDGRKDDANAKCNYFKWLK